MTDSKAALRRISRYADYWTEVLTLARERVDAGETSLSRVLRQVEAAWRKTDVLEPTGGTALGRTVEMPKAALIGGRQALWRQILINVCRPDTSLVVEVGCGWGNNLLDLYASGGPRDATYFGLEPTQSGRECFLLIAALDANLAARAAVYDYAEPTYDAIPRGHSHAVIFTSHSIEQIPELRRAAITRLLGLADKVTGVHFEPIGWQIREEQGIPAAPTGATRAYSERKRYNKNFWQILQAVEQEGRITIETAIPDIFCHKTEDVSSLVVWSAQSSRGCRGENHQDNVG